MTVFTVFVICMPWNTLCFGFSDGEHKVLEILYRIQMCRTLKLTCLKNSSRANFFELLPELSTDIFIGRLGFYDFRQTYIANHAKQTFRLEAATWPKIFGISNASNLSLRADIFRSALIVKCSTSARLNLPYKNGE